MSKKAKLEPDVDAAQAVADAALADLYDQQSRLEKLNDEASEKVLKIEEEYNRLRKPVYADRSASIDLIPDFWYQCFLQHPFLADMLTPEDMEILGYLRQVKVEDFNDIRAGHKIILQFAENPFFSDMQLSKSFEYDSEDGQLLCSSPGIHWYPGKDPSQAAEQETAKRPRDQESFFLWFPLEGEPYHTAHDAIAEAIKDHLWLNPIKYYIGDLEEWEQAGEDDADEDGRVFYSDGEEYLEDAEAGDYDEGEGAEDEEGQEGDEEPLEGSAIEGDEGQEYDEEQDYEEGDGDGDQGEDDPPD